MMTSFTYPETTHHRVCSPTSKTRQTEVPTVRHTSCMRKGTRLWPTNAVAAFVMLVIAGTLVVVSIYGGLYYSRHRTPTDGFPISLTYRHRHYNRNGDPVADMPRPASGYDYSKVDHIDDENIDLYAAIRPGRPVTTSQPVTVLAQGANGMFVPYTLQGGP